MSYHPPPLLMQGLSLNMEFTGPDWLARELLVSPLPSLSPGIKRTLLYLAFFFFTDAEVLNSGPHAYSVNTLPTQ